MLAHVDTPQVVLDLKRLQANIASMQARAERHGLRLRPHAKTHKCVDVARLQLAAGAVGLTAAKVDEALVFLAGGAPSLTLAYPLLSEDKLDRLLPAAAHADLRCIADSLPGVAALSLAAQRHGRILPVLLKVDVGLHRCGVPPEDPVLLRLARAIAESPHLRLAGILSHAGHVYGAPDIIAARRIAREEAAAMESARQRLADAGFPVAEVSVGATPTVLAAEDFGPATEIRPGNYVFLDRASLRLGLATPADVALYVVAAVAGRNPSHAILDAGSKTLSSDMGAHGSGGPGGYGLAWPLEDDYGATPLVVERLSEEHGFLRRDPAAGWDPDLGERVRILPNHACPVANLADRFLILDPANPDQTPVYWRPGARGAVR